MLLAGGEPDLLLSRQQTEKSSETPAARISMNGTLVLGGMKMSQWIPWLPQYNVNVPDIDHQHSELFRIMNELLDATWDGKGKEFMKDALIFFAHYTVNHFATEEDYMRTYSYPDHVVHKKAHDDLTTQVTDFINSYDENGISTDLLVSVILGIGNWTWEHIRGMDQELGQFLVAKGVAPGDGLAGDRETTVRHLGSTRP
jgi:hemerythrin